MQSVWCVGVQDSEKNFPKKRDAVAWLRKRTADTRIRPIVRRRCRGAYTFYGPGDGDVVLTASIDNLGFYSVRNR